MLRSMPLISTPLKETADNLEEAIEENLELSKSQKNQSTDGTQRTDNSENEDLVSVNINPGNLPCAAPNAASTSVSDIIPSLASDVVETETNKSSEELHTEGESQSVEGQENLERTVKKDNEDELAALMLASSTIKAPKPRSTNTVKKKSKHVRDIEATVKLLAPEKEDVQNDKAFGFAQAYFMKVTERLEGKDNDLYQEFLRTMNDFGQTIFTVPELYHKITAIFHQHPDLAEEFLTFLLPEQAMECGKFMEYLMLTKMRSFFRKLEVYFEKQPQQMQKIYSALCTLSNENTVTLQDVHSSILPLLKGNAYLIDSFMQLLPQERPPASIVSEFEEVDCSEVTSQRNWGDHFETVDIPDQKDVYGGDNCLCICHQTGDDRYQKRAQHCVSCGSKFMYGRVFVQTGKVLRPAKIIFDDSFANQAIKRLSRKEHPKKYVRKKTHTVCKSANTRKSQNGELLTISPKPTKSSRTRIPTHAHRKTAYRSLSKTATSEGRKTDNNNDFKIGSKDSEISISHSFTSQSHMETSCNESTSLHSAELHRNFSMVNTPSKNFSFDSQQLGSNIQCDFKMETSESPEILSHKRALSQDSSSDLDMEVDSVSMESDNKRIRYSSLDESSSTSWTREEDKIILQTFQLETNIEQTFLKINQHLTQRSLEEIRGRFSILMSLLEKMTGVKMEQGSK